jgi:hypothetical protein
MLGAVLLIAGVILMAVGLVFLGGWVNGRNERANRTGEDETDEADNNASSNIPRQLMDLVFMDLSFFGLVIAPLLAGAMLIAFGLGMLLR